MSACGMACEALKPLWYAFHRQILAAAGTDKADWQCYRDAAIEANGKAPTDATCRAQASKGRADAKVKAALDHHRAPATAKAQATFEDHVTRLLARTTQNAADFFRVNHTTPEPELLRMIAAEPDPDKRRRAVARLQSVELLPFDEIPRERWELVQEIGHDKAGRVRIKFESRQVAEAQLQKAMGWEAAQKHEVEFTDATTARDRLAEQISRRARSGASGDSGEPE